MGSINLLLGTSKNMANDHPFTGVFESFHNKVATCEIFLRGVFRAHDLFYPCDKNIFFLPYLDPVAPRTSNSARRTCGVCAARAGGVELRAAISLGATTKRQKLISRPRISIIFSRISNRKLEFNSCIYI